MFKILMRLGVGAGRDQSDEQKRGQSSGEGDRE
jgi:hypothetical protein